MSAPPEPDPRPAEPGPPCAEAQRLLGEFLGGSPLSREADRGFRLHLTSCPSCRQSYREALASAARLGRTIREARERDLRLGRRAEGRRRALAAGTRTVRGRGWWKLALIPALLVFALVRANPFGADAVLEARWSAGGVRAAGTRLGAEEPARELARGDWCLTDEDASAHLAASGVRIGLGARTQLLVEDARVPRVRLQRGALDLRGACTVTSPVGVVELFTGRARLELEGERLSIECLAGELDLSTSTGARRVRAGERAEVELTSVVVGTL
jgi:hypothetical protein